MNNKNIYSVCKKLLKTKYNDTEYGIIGLHQLNEKSDEIYELNSFLRFIISRIESNYNGKITLSFYDIDNKKAKIIEVYSLEEMFKELINNKKIIGKKNIAEQYEQICSVFLKE